MEYTRCCGTPPNHTFKRQRTYSNASEFANNAQHFWPEAQSQSSAIEPSSGPLGLKWQRTTVDVSRQPLATQATSYHVPGVDNFIQQCSGSTFIQQCSPVTQRLLGAFAGARQQAEVPNNPKSLPSLFVSFPYLCVMVRPVQGYLRDRHQLLSTADSYAAILRTEERDTPSTRRSQDPSPSAMADPDVQASTHSPRPSAAGHDRAEIGPFLSNVRAGNATTPSPASTTTPSPASTIAPPPPPPPSSADTTGLPDDRRFGWVDLDILRRDPVAQEGLLDAARLALRGVDIKALLLARKVFPRASAPVDFRAKATRQVCSERAAILVDPSTPKNAGSSPEDCCESLGWFGGSGAVLRTQSHDSMLERSRFCGVSIEILRTQSDESIGYHRALELGTAAPRGFGAGGQPRDQPRVAAPKGGASVSTPRQQESPHLTPPTVLAVPHVPTLASHAPEGGSSRGATPHASGCCPEDACSAPSGCCAPGSCCVDATIRVAIAKCPPKAPTRGCCPPNAPPTTARAPTAAGGCSSASVAGGCCEPSCCDAASGCCPPNMSTSDTACCPPALRGLVCCPSRRRMSIGSLCDEQGGGTLPLEDLLKVNDDTEGGASVAEGSACTCGHSWKPGDSRCCIRCWAKGCSC